MPKRYSPEFRRKVLDLVKEGRPIAEVASDLGVTASSIYVWRKQEQIDSGQRPRLSSTDNVELRAARRRIAELAFQVRYVRCAGPGVVAQVQPLAILVGNAADVLHSASRCHHLLLPVTLLVRRTRSGTGHVSIAGRTTKSVTYEMACSGNSTTRRRNGLGPSPRGFIPCTGFTD